MNRRLKTLVLLLVIVNTAASDRLRVLVETDAGGDPDDEQSLVRFLLYANEWDVEGIIATRSEARAGENKNIERTGLGIVRRQLDAYASCYTNLIVHDSRYPPPEKLRARVVSGYAGVDDGVEQIIKAVDADDARPLWFMNWGTDAGSGPSNLKRALDKVHNERGQAGYTKFKRRIYLSSADKFEEHTFQLEPSFQIWVDTFRPPMAGKRWYHRFSAITAHAGGFDLMRDVLNAHGPLGALYPTNTTHWQKEGDTMTFLYLIPTGMNDPMRPGWGSWGGRYGPMEDAVGKAYFWANQTDSWNGTTQRDNVLARWATHLQNDFRARLDWCMKPYALANHSPLAVLDGDRSQEIIFRQAIAGETFNLTAEGSSDPDGNTLKYEWFVFPEAGTYKGSVTLENAQTARVSFVVPSEGSRGSVHLILIVSDDGSPSLVSYRRAIVHL